MNRPAQRNAMSMELVQALIAALDRLNGDDQQAAVIVLTGAGTGFCAGSDLGGLAASTPAGRRLFETESGRLARLIGSMPQPVIAAVDGFAIGGGLTLATSCDLIVSHGKAKWSLPEVPIGLFPAWGLTSVVDRVGMPKARRLAWGIDTLTGDEAYRLGLVDFVVETSAQDEAMRIAEVLAKLPALQSKFVKEYFASTRNAAREDADFIANELFMRATMTDAAAASFRKFGSR